MTGSPVVAINRAVAVAETRGARRGPRALDALAGRPRGSPTISRYWAARAGLLARIGHVAEADRAH